MKKKLEIIHPTHCFCQVPHEELQHWADMRYGEKRDTVSLLQEAKSPQEKEAISIVALLDVDENALLTMMGDVDKPDHHILHCRENVKEILNIEEEESPK